VDTFQLKVNVIGEFSLLPANVAVIAKKVVEKTQNNQGVVLNLCLAYSSILETQKAIRLATLSSKLENILNENENESRTIVNDRSLYFSLENSSVVSRTANRKVLKSGKIIDNFCNVGSTFTNATKESKIKRRIHDYNKDDSIPLKSTIVCHEKEVRKYLDIKENVDLMVRTSGEIRLSDFLLLQSNTKTLLYFSKLNWPEFSQLEFFKAILEYQYHLPKIL